MASVLVAAAATLGVAGHDGDLDTVERIAEAITPFLGEFGGKLLFGLGLAGAALSRPLSSPLPRPVLFPSFSG